MQKYHLSTDEFSSIEQLASGALSTVLGLLHDDDGENVRFAWEAQLLSHDLPKGLRAALLRFRNEQPEDGLFLISGLGSHAARLPPTPASWQTARGTAPLQEKLLILCCSLLGQPFGWAAQQAGALVHNILPMAEHENLQVGSSSGTELAWHTEDAFHPGRADYVGLLCLRNEEGVATTVASLAGVELQDKRWDPLWEDRFVILPDDSYFPEYRDGSMPAGPCGDAEEAQVRKWAASPQPVAVLFGHRDEPFLRIDPAYMSAADGDPAAAFALHALQAVIQSRLHEIVLQSGDLLMIDNYRAVHGRRPFRARYSGTSRWLKRLSVARDSRRTAAFRQTLRSHLILR